MGVIAELAQKVLVLNAGSSSLKFKLFDIQPFKALVAGNIERIGDAVNSQMVVKDNSGQATVKIPAEDHTGALQHALSYLRDTVSSSIERDVTAVGHRVVHGLNCSKPALITDSVISTIQDAIVLAPLHNPPVMSVFDTAFHQTMPPHAYMYPLPYTYYEKYHIRKYGFHGSSYKYLVGEVADLLDKPATSLNMVLCHLGNGSSMCAVQNGICLDTTMGMTPLEGLMMGTRTGDMDAAVPLHLIKACGVSLDECHNLLNKKSGLLGITGASDLRTVIQRRADGDERAVLAMDMFIYRIRKYIGAYTVALGGKLDALVFSAGIGENSALVRELVCKDLQWLGVELDEALNRRMCGGAEGAISSSSSRVKVLVVPTDEEVSIAQQTLEVVHGAT